MHEWPLLFAVLLSQKSKIYKYTSIEWTVWVLAPVGVEEHPLGAQREKVTK